jgi:hypothetical protein
MERGPRETKERGNGYGVFVPSKLDRRGSHRDFQRARTGRATYSELSARGAGFGATGRAPCTACTALARSTARSAERSAAKRAAAAVTRAEHGTGAGRPAERRSATLAGNAE